MPHVALICPPLPGHLNPVSVLGRALQRRGHKVSLFGIPATADAARAQRLDFFPIGQGSSETLAESVRKMAELEGLRSLRFAVECSRRIADLLCRELPSALAAEEVDLLLVDQNEPAGGTVAEHVGLPFVSVCPSLPLNREPLIPPPFVPWNFSASVFARLRNKLGYLATDRLIGPINATINSCRRRWNLPELRKPDDSFSTIGQLCQMTADFDFPRRNLPPTFHYLGPFVEQTASRIPFSFERLDGRPLIFASLGTLQSKDNRLFSTIAAACEGLDVQLVLALGSADRSSREQFAGNPIVVGFAPQLELLARASLAITHAGLNTVMQALSCGVPLVALPITHDQPAIAARVAHSGAGKVIPAASINPASLRAAVSQVLKEPRYRERARALSCSIARAGGVERAADIVDSVLATHRATHHALRNH